MKISTPALKLILAFMVLVFSVTETFSYDIWERIPSPATNDVNLLKMTDDDDLYR